MTEKRINIEKGILIAAISALFIILCFFIVKPAEVDAASSYKAIPYEKCVDNNPVKVNGYYFKYNNKEQLCISKKKSSGYKNTKIEAHDAWTNGKTIYFTKYETAIYKYTISSKKTKEVIDLYKRIVGRYGAVYITKIYKNKIYLTSCDWDGYADTYYYDIKEKKTKKVKSNADILASSGKYCVCENYISDDEVASVKLTLYKITSSGKFKKIEMLTKQGAPYVRVSDGKFYYAKYSSSTSFKKASVYRVKTNGKSKKKMITISGSYDIFPEKLSKNSCKFMDTEGNIYKYKY